MFGAPVELTGRGRNRPDPSPVADGSRPESARTVRPGSAGACCPSGHRPPLGHSGRRTTADRMVSRGTALGTQIFRNRGTGVPI